VICGCHGVALGDITALAEGGTVPTDAVIEAFGAGTECGACWQRLLAVTQGPAGVACRVVDREQLAEQAFRCRLAPADGKRFPTSFRSGQHAQVAVPTPEGWQSRPYTLVSDPADDSAWEILVRRHEDGAVSPLLSDPDGPSEVMVGPPAGYGFDALTRGRNKVLIVAGIGLTPALAASHLPDAGIRHAHLVTRSSADTLTRLFRERLSQTGATIAVHDSSTMGRFDAQTVHELARRYDASTWFLCGPEAFMDGVRKALETSGVPAHAIHQEFFEQASRPQGPPPARPRLPRERRVSILSGITLSLWVVGLALSPGWLEKLGLLSGPARLVTGGVLLACVLAGLILPAHRALGQGRHIADVQLRHRLIGSASLLAFAFHARSFGYGLTGILGGSFVLGAALGLVDRTAIPSRRLRVLWSHAWLPLHVLAAALVVTLGLWHSLTMLTHMRFNP